MKRGIFAAFALLLIAALVAVFHRQIFAPFLLKSQVSIDWVTFVRWDGVSYEPSYPEQLVPERLIREQLGTVKQEAPSTVSDADYQPKNGMAAGVPVGTRLYRINGCDSKKYIAVRNGAGYLLYRSRDADPVTIPTGNTG